MDYYEQKRKEFFEAIKRQQEEQQQATEEPDLRPKVQTEFIKVDENGEMIEPVLIEHYEDEEPQETEELKRPPGQEKRLFKPKFDKALKAWVEGLPGEEITARENEIQEQAAAPTPEARTKALEERSAKTEKDLSGVILKLAMKKII